MDVSSTSYSSPQETMDKTQGSQDVMTKAQDVQAQQILKTLESVNEQSKEMTAQKTGMGNSLNITG